MSDIVRIKVWVKTDKIGSRCEDIVEFPREEWESMTDEEREEDCRGAAFNMGEWGYEEVGGDE